MVYLVIETNKNIDLAKLKNQKDKNLNFKSLEVRYTKNSTLIFIKFKKTISNKEIDKLRKEYNKETLGKFLNLNKIISIDIKSYDDIKMILKPPVNRTVKAKTSKGKGKRLENMVAKLFETKLNLKKGSVHRAQSSGTFQYDIGDIRFNLPIPVIIECKNNEGWSFKQLLNNDNNLPSIFKNWIEQIKDEMKKAFKLYPDIFNEENIIWFLIFSKNNEAIYLLTDEKVINKLLHNDKQKVKLKQDIRSKLSHLRINEYSIYNLERFLEYLIIDF